MKATSVASVGIVPEVLTLDNYDRWSVFMENYLIGKGLWEVVTRERDYDIEQGLEEDKTDYSRRMKNAKALHIIQISCERHIQNELFHFHDANLAWFYLASRYGGISSELYPSHKVILDNSFSHQHRELFRKVTRGNYIENIINSSSSNLYITSSATGRTLLHVAVISGNVDNVKMLIAKGWERLLLMQDNDGDTALSLVARYAGNTDMAKCMIETKYGSGEKLLEMQNNENIIPILMAAANGHRELTIYLYSKTSPKVFDGNDSKNRILLLSLCITAEIFDVALKLLKRYQDLPKESLSSYNFDVPKSLRESLSLPTKILELDSNQKPVQSEPDKFSVLVALAKIPSAFPSGNQFSRQEQFIYDSKCLQLSPPTTTLWYNMATEPLD